MLERRCPWDLPAPPACIGTFCASRRLNRNHDRNEASRRLQSLLKARAPCPGLRLCLKLLCLARDRQRSNVEEDLNANGVIDETLVSEWSN